MSASDAVIIRNANRGSLPMFTTTHANRSPSASADQLLMRSPNMSGHIPQLAQPRTSGNPTRGTSSPSLVTVKTAEDKNEQSNLNISSSNHNNTNNKNINNTNFNAPKAMRQPAEKNINNQIPDGKTVKRTFCDKLLSVRCLTTLLCVFLIILAAFATLLVSSHFSMNAAREIAVTHAVSVANDAKGQIEALLDKPVSSLASWQYMFARGHHPIPGEKTFKEPNATGWEPYFELEVSFLKTTHFVYNLMIVAFVNGNVAGCSTYTEKVFVCRAIRWRALEGQSGEADRGEKHFDYFKGYLVNSYQSVFVKETFTYYEARDRDWYTTINKSDPHAIQWTPVFLSSDNPKPAVNVMATLYNASGTFLGVVAVFFDVSVLSVFLERLVVTPNTAAVLIDSQGLILASSIDATNPVLDKKNLTDDDNSVKPDNCMRSNVSTGALYYTQVCRPTALTYSYAPLRKLAQRDPDLVAHGGRGAQIMDLGGEFIVASVAIESPESTGMNWSFVVLIPENDVVGGIIRGRDLAIFITIAIVGLAAILCFGIVTLLLRPLRQVADRMYRVAALQDMDEEKQETADDTESDGERILGEEDVVKTRVKVAPVNTKKTSRLYEISVIQTAFSLLVAELSKVKSFLPQSVLAQLYGTDDENEQENEDGMNGISQREQSQSHIMYSSSLAEQSRRTHNTATSSSIPSNSMISGSEQRHAHHNKLNTQMTLSQRKVSVLVVNMRQYHMLGGKLGADRIGRLHADIVGMISAVCSEHRGVLDGFQGDRFTASFNAVTTVGSHATASAHAALAIRRGLCRIQSSRKNAAVFASARIPLAMTCGLSSGQAVVGNMGSTAVKRFTVLGPVVTSAALLERLCKRYRPFVDVLVDGASVPDIENFFYVLLRDCISMPAVVGGRRTLIASLHSAKDLQSDEWMYQIEQGASASPFTSINEAFTAFFTGRSTNEDTACAAERVLSSDTLAPLGNSLIMGAMNGGVGIFGSSVDRNGPLGDKQMHNQISHVESFGSNSAGNLLRSGRNTATGNNSVVAPNGDVKEVAQFLLQLAKQQPPIAGATYTHSLADFYESCMIPQS